MAECTTDATSGFRWLSMDAQNPTVTEVEVVDVVALEADLEIVVVALDPGPDGQGPDPEVAASPGQVPGNDQGHATNVPHQLPGRPIGRNPSRGRAPNPSPDLNQDPEQDQDLKISSNEDPVPH